MLVARRHQAKINMGKIRCQLLDTPFPHRNLWGYANFVFPFDLIPIYYFNSGTHLFLIWNFVNIGFKILKICLKYVLKYMTSFSRHPKITQNKGVFEMSVLWINKCLTVVFLNLWKLFWTSENLRLFSYHLWLIFCNDPLKLTWVLGSYSYKW